MKKLKLNLQQLGNAEVLTRAQLKTILGGEEGSGGGETLCISKCNYDKWDTATLSYKKITGAFCNYTSIGNVGNCSCPGTVNATACS